MLTFTQYLTEMGPEFTKGGEPTPDHTKNPFHKTLTDHGFKHKASQAGPYKGTEWHEYEHPEHGHVHVTVAPKGHGMAETHWSHDHPNPEHRSRTSSAGRTPKALHDYLSHGPDRTTAKIRGVHHRGF